MKQMKLILMLGFFIMPIGIQSVRAEMGDGKCCYDISGYCDASCGICYDCSGNGDGGGDDPSNGGSNDANSSCEFTEGTPSIDPPHGWDLADPDVLLCWEECIPQLLSDESVCLAAYYMSQMNASAVCRAACAWWNIPCKIAAAAARIAAGHQAKANLQNCLRDARWIFDYNMENCVRERRDE